MLYTRSRLVAAAALSAAALMGCSAPTPPEAAPPPAQPLPDAVVFGEFLAHVSPRNRTMTIEQVGDGHAWGPTLQPQSLDSLPILNNGVEGSGPANSVELVTNSITGDQPTWTANVTLRHFYARSFANVFIQIPLIMDTSRNPLDNHDATNSDASEFGVSNAHGLWQYTASGAAAGVLGASPYNDATRDWTFANPDEADTLIQIIAYGSLGFGDYTEDYGSATYVDACSTGTTTTSAQVTTSMPFDFTLYNTNSTSVTFGDNGQVAFGGTSLSISGTSVALPDGTAPHAALFPFWDDLTYGSGGQMCYTTVGSAPARQFVIEWQGMDFASGAGTGSSLDFEAILSEGTSRIDLVYDSMVGGSGSDGREAGALATVGVQDETATVAAGEHDQTHYGTGQAYVFVPAPF
jgi:hypothetical protein